MNGTTHIACIRSGGQSGVDRAALDAARDADVPICGWCPRGGWAEDFPEPPGVLTRYPQLREASSSDVAQRTEWNVRDSDATLVIAPGGMSVSAGTLDTVAFAEDYGKPCMVLDDFRLDNRELPQGQNDEAMRMVANWIRSMGGSLELNVAGPRESELPGVYKFARSFIEELLARLDKEETSF